MSPRTPPGDARRARPGDGAPRRRNPAGGGRVPGDGPSTANPPFDPPDWPASHPETWPLRRITPYPNNARTHPAAQVTLLAELLKKQGVDQPIVVDEDGVILKGHGRRLAAVVAGFEVFPVVVRRGLSEPEKTAMRIQDNQVALLSGWDRELIRNEMAHLKAAGFEMPLLGFGDGELVAFMTTPGPPDEFPEYGDGIETHYKCPKCGYRWSGKPGDGEHE